MSQTQTWDVRGMHCTSCEQLIERAIRPLPGVQTVSVHLGRNRLTITHEAHTDFDDALSKTFNELGKHGYSFSPILIGATGSTCDIQPSSKPLWGRILRAGFFVAGTGLVIGVVLAPLREIIPSVTAQLTIGAMFFLGVIASLSTCLASTGGFLLAYTSQTKGFRTHFFVHLGRFAAFIVGGALLGAIGETLPIFTGTFYGWFSLLLGITFLVVALQLLEISPSLASFGLRLPKRLTELSELVQRSNKPYAPLLVGAVTFIIPCGFTQTAQALALASGSMTTGAFMLGIFALGTLPTLIGLTLFGTSATLANPIPRAIVGAVLFFFAFGQIDGGLTIIGSPYTVSTVLAGATSTNSAEPLPYESEREQVVEMHVIYGTYKPKNLTVKKGIPVRWIIHGDDVSGCASDITVPTLGISRPLKVGTNVILFTPTVSGVIPFSCGMGMIRGTFTVVN